MEFHFQSLVAKKFQLFSLTEFPFLVPKLKKWAQGFPFCLNGPSRKLEKPTFQNFRMKKCFRDLSKCDRICLTETLVWCLCTGSKLFLTSTTIICIWFWNSDFPKFESKLKFAILKCCGVTKGSHVSISQSLWKSEGFLSILPNFHFWWKTKNAETFKFFHFIEFPFYREETVVHVRFFGTQFI